MPVIEPGRRSPSWEKVRSRSRFSCSSWDRVGGKGTSITERTIYVQKPATKKNGLTFAISMSHTRSCAPHTYRDSKMIDSDSSHVSITLIVRGDHHGIATSSIFHRSCAMEELSRSFPANPRCPAGDQPDGTGSRRRTRAEIVFARETHHAAHT